MCSAPPVLALIAIFLVTAVLTWLTRHFALRQGMIDVPNERSSHVDPTPRGGGMAIAVVTTGVLGFLTWRGDLSIADFGVLGAGGMGIALLGFADDCRQLSTYLRLGVHLAAATWAIVLLQGLPPILVGGQLISLGWFGYVFGALGIAWMLNLFNFMDGIDGIAASEAAFVGIAGALILAFGCQSSGFGAAGITLGIACLGFLLWNWPPARIFMGDAGSGYLGYYIACLAILAGHENPVALPVFLILSGVFVVDATVTFVRRIARNERFDVGHRTHGYQQLARRWRSHRKVTVTVLLLNVLLLLPMAMLAARQPAWAASIALGVMALLIIAAILIGCGIHDRPSTEIPPRAGGE
jgi:Fuc2NAc and GlcNAc transferase